MKPHPKEKLNNKAYKMIDLIIDEISEGGSKTITAGFVDEKEKKQFILTVGLTVSSTTDSSSNEPVDVCENCSCNNNQQTTTEEPDPESENP